MTVYKVGVRASANWDLCPELTLPSGVAGTTCQGTVQFGRHTRSLTLKKVTKICLYTECTEIEHFEASTCMVVCEEGKVATGRRRIKCRWKRKKGFFWKSVSSDYFRQVRKTNRIQRVLGIITMCRLYTRSTTTN